VNSELKGFWKEAVQVPSELLFGCFYAETIRENLTSAYVASEPSSEHRASRIRSSSAARSAAMFCHVLVENLTVVQLAKKFPNIYGIRRFVSSAYV
jgi:hypothetical protein